MCRRPSKKRSHYLRPTWHAFALLVVWGVASWAKTSYAQSARAQGDDIDLKQALSTARVALLPVQQGNAAVALAANIEAALLSQLRSWGANVFLAKERNELSCLELRCVKQINHTLGTDFTVFASVLGAAPNTTTQATNLPSLSITVVNSDDHSYSAEAPLDQHDVATTTSQVLTQALKQFVVGNSATLVINTRPSGASVFVDGVPVGKTPYRSLSEHGLHSLSVELKGYRRIDKQVQLSALRNTTVDFVLSPTGKPQTKVEAGRADAATKGSIANWLIAGGLVAAATPLLISSIRTALNDAECRGQLSPSGQCERHVSFGGQDRLFLLAGSAALIGAATMLIVQPIQVSVDPISRRAQVDLHLSF